MVEESLRMFLEKFAELERRVRKMAVENRSTRDEVASLREKVRSMEAENSRLRVVLEEERSVRTKASAMIGDLIESIESLGDSSSREEDGESDSFQTREAGVIEGER